jgi:hypothetical protein
MNNEPAMTAYKWAKENNATAQMIMDEHRSMWRKLRQEKSAEKRMLISMRIKEWVGEEMIEFKTAMAYAHDKEHHDRLRREPWG